MKFLLAAVTALVVFTTDGRHFRDEPGEQLGKTDEAQLITHETEEEGGQHYSLNGPEQDQLLEKKEKQHDRKSQKPKCKRSDVCWVMGGFCVTNATLCDGRLMPEGCKGKKCQCCVPGTIEAKFDKLEKSLQSLKESMDIKLQSNGDTLNASKVDLGSINIELQSMGNNLNASKADQDSMNIKLQSIGDTLNASKADLDSEFHSLTLNLNTSFSILNSKIDSLPTIHDHTTLESTTVSESSETSVQTTTVLPACTGDFFRLSGYNQCFKLLTDSQRSWLAGKTKCQQEGLLLAKPENPVVLRRYIVTTYGDKWVWIGGYGAGSNVKWDRDGTILSSSDPAWYPNGVSGRTSANYCLALLSYVGNMNVYPTKPYYMYSSCSSSNYVLCELV